MREDAACCDILLTGAALCLFAIDLNGLGGLGLFLWRGGGLTVTFNGHSKKQRLGV